MRDEPDVELRRPNVDSPRFKGCCCIMTAGRWPWKSESAKKCVKTYLPNTAAPKMDGAEIDCPHSTDAVNAKLRRVGRRGRRVEGFPVRVAGAASGADLGGSSN